MYTFIKRVKKIELSYHNVNNPNALPKVDLARLTNVGGEQIASLDAEEDLQRKLLRKVEMN